MFLLICVVESGSFIFRDVPGGPGLSVDVCAELKIICEKLIESTFKSIKVSDSLLADT